MLDGSGLTAPLPAIAAPAAYGSLEAVKQAMIDRAVSDWGWALGTRIPNNGRAIDGPMGSAAMNTAAPPPSLARATAGTPTGASGAALTPGTNPAPGDIVAGDGRTLFVLTGQKLKIVDARDPSGLSLLATVDLKATTVAEYLNGHTLTVISQDNSWGGSGTGGIADPPGLTKVAGGASRSMMMPWSFHPRVNVAEFDVSNPAQPRLLRQTTFDGSYIQSQADGARLNLVLSPSFPSLPGPETSAAGPDAQVYETEAEYRTRLQQLDISKLVPSYTTTVRNAVGIDTTTSAPLFTPQDLYKPATSDDYGLLSVVSLDTSRAGNGVTGAIGITAGAASATLFDGDALYLASPTYVADLADAPNSGGDATILRAIDLSGPRPVYNAVGVVPGSTLNAAALDAEGGQLRVATTVYHWAETGDASVNNLYVLEAKGAVLSTVGKLEGLAPGSAFTAARFVGDHAYLATSAPTSALTVVDLTDPTKPQASSKPLALPGVFTTMKAIDATHIVSIGRADDNGVEPSQAVKIMLLDIADPDQPRVADVEAIAGDWAWSSAAYDPQALFFDPATSTLAVPVNVMRTSGPNGPPTGTNGLEVLRLSAADGLTALARTRQDSDVVRTVAIGGVLYAIGANTIQASPLNAPDQTLGSLMITTPGERLREIEAAVPYAAGALTTKRPISALRGGQGGVGRTSTPSRPTLPVIQPARRVKRSRPVTKPIVHPRPLPPRLAFLAGRARNLGGRGRLA